MKFSAVTIIYNPKSTGKSETAGKKLKRELEDSLKDTEIQMVATEYAGHAEELAYELSKKYKQPLIVSSSGDGGYHEVVNGIMRARSEGHKPICAVIPAGNANDHARTMHRSTLKELIIKAEVKKLDLLKVTTTYRGKSSVRYAHSYIGLGLTPAVAAELNNHKLNSLTEAWIVAKSLWTFSPVRLAIDNKLYAIDSIICSTIPQMSKILTISKKAKPDDGIFEVTLFEHSRRPRLLYRLLKGALSEMEVDKQVKKLKIKLLAGAPVQFDGEVKICKKGSTLRIDIEKQALNTIA